MSFSINTNNLHDLDSFIKAKQFYENTDAVGQRTKEKDGVPLHWDRKSADTYWLGKTWDAKGAECYSAGYHHTECVTWHANGDISINASWDSRNTRDFINHYVPYWIDISARRNWQVWAFKAVELCPRQRAKAGDNVWINLIIRGDTLHIHHTKTGWRIPETSILKTRTRRIDRKKSKAARADFDPFFAFAKMFDTCPLTPLAIKSIEGEPGWSRCYFDAIQFVDQWYRGMVKEEDWIRAVSTYHSDEGYFSMADMKSVVYKHAYDFKNAFKFKTMPWGTLPNDVSTMETTA